ncbi:PKD domain-containing protein [Candidatus Bathyarchaeota archaeon]|nr:MAG: PKD domain-containing protein [Candidatus Bathyarchaeota archaeon]
MMSRYLSRRLAKTLLSAAIMLLLALSTAQVLSPPSVTVHAASPAFDHVVTILMENNGYCDVMTTCGGSGTYMTSLAHSYSVVKETGYTGVSHPSEGNYVALIGGDTFGFTGDCGYCPGRTNAPNLIDRIEASGRTWQAWAEDASGSATCSFQPPRGTDHFAFPTFTDNLTPARCSHFLTTTSSGDAEFIYALNSASPANYIWLTPNDSDNCHDTSIPTCDAYVAALVPQILNSNLFKSQKTALFIVYDEGNGSPPSDWLYATWAGPVVKTGYVGSGSYSHYSYLSTLETVWGLPSLTSNDAGAPAMTEFFGACTSGCSSGTLSSSFTASSSSPQSGESVTFTGSASGGSASYTYSWDFGDGSNGAGQTVMHAYSTSGSYTASLTVTDAIGASSGYSKLLTVAGPTSPSNQPAGQGTCVLCQLTSSLGTNLWLVVAGGLFALMASMSVLYLRVRNRLKDARTMKRNSR